MAIKANLIIDQGTDYSTSIDVTDDNDVPIDLTGYTAASHMRKHYTSTKKYSFTASVVPELGQVVLAANNTLTDSIPAGRYVYDCELTDLFGNVSRLVEGIVTITPSTTR